MNKRAWRANTLFAAYAPPGEYRAENERLPWMLLATHGEGGEAERWLDVMDRPVWFDYELCWHNDAGRCVGRGDGHRPKWPNCMRNWVRILRGNDTAQVARTPQRIANQPGFHGVRSQSMAVCPFATGRGYEGPLPKSFIVQQVAHGKHLLITSSNAGTPPTNTSRGGRRRDFFRVTALMPHRSWTPLGQTQAA